MRILSMTATFGKLYNETIRFDPKLQVIEAPNEWGKSTWCAFITAMLYGIDSSKRVGTSVLTDKEHYSPWSGAPMAGRMDIDWNGRPVTIERQTKGRGYLNHFRAYNTQSGTEITELTADNCGLVLLGIEKEVFLRSAFIKQSDLPVSDNQALHARLNALVTTGDDSGAAEALAEKLNNLKNKCRHNKTGLLPEAERQREALRLKLRQLRELQSQQIHLTEQLEGLQAYEKQLTNHQAALTYAESLAYTQKLTAAQGTRDLALAKVSALETDCAGLAAEEQLEQQLSTLRQLRQQREDVQLLSQPMSAPPQRPIMEEGCSVEQAEADYAAYSALKQRSAPLPLILAAVLFILSIGCLLLPMPYTLLAALPIIAGLALVLAAMGKTRKKAAAMQQLLAKHPGIAPESWVTSAQNRANILEQYEAQVRAYEQHTQAMQQQVQALKEQTNALTGGLSLAEFEHQLLTAKQKRSALADARRELARAEELLSALQSSKPTAQPPTEADELTCDGVTTRRLIAETAANINQVQHLLSKTQGQMAALEQEELLSAQFDEVCDRITRLEQVHSAVTLAQEYLNKATLELQQRFAPRISQRAQAIMAELTDGRYDRLYLKNNLTLDTGAQGEVPLHAPQWRSDGTIDQLYFALRLAVAQELSPEAPLILDDAFVRFDDGRLMKALELLKAESEEKQVLIFTCQSRENRLLAAE